MAIVSASSAAASQLTRKPIAATEATAHHGAERQRLPLRHGPARDRPHRGARHFGVDVGVPPHVERAARPGPGRHRGQVVTRRSQSIGPGREHIADRAGEDDERHHAGLQKNEMIEDAAPGTLDLGAPAAV